jgi:hypothetical protein
MAKMAMTPLSFCSYFSTPFDSGLKVNPEFKLSLSMATVMIYSTTGVEIKE